jgi:flagellar assembly protein FliH
MGKVNLTLRFTVPPRSVHLAGSVSRAAYTFQDLERARGEGYAAARSELIAQCDARIAKVSDDSFRLQKEVLKRLEDRVESVLKQVREVLPQLVLESSARILASTPIDGAVLDRIIRELLSEVLPDSEDLEVQLSPADFALISARQAEWGERYPRIEFRSNEELRSGDCVVRTNFGIVDGRMQTKFRALDALLK